jgi:hypothetical protein
MENIKKIFKKDFNKPASESVIKNVIKKASLVVQIPTELVNIYDKVKQDKLEKSFSNKVSFEQKLTDDEIIFLQETFSLARQLPRAEKIQKLKDIKETVNWFRIELVKKETFLIHNLSEDIFMEEQDVRDLFQKTFEEFPFSDNQRDKMEDILDSFCIRHNKVIEMRKGFPDDKSLFRELIGVDPVDEVSIITTPIGFYIRAQNDIDYTKVYNLHRIDWSCFDLNTNVNRKVFNEMYEKANKTSGVKIYTSRQKELEGGGITAENSNYSHFLGENKKTFIHETQHALYSFFDTKIEDVCTQEYFAQRFSEITDNDPDKLNSIIKELYEMKLESLENRGKNELFAMYSENKSFDYIFSTLTEREGSYDYFANSKYQYVNIPYLNSRYHPDYPMDYSLPVNEYLKLLEFVSDDSRFRSSIIEELAIDMQEPIFYDLYHKHLKEGLESIKILENEKMPRSVIIQLLTHEPLQSWPRIARNIKKTT